MSGKVPNGWTVKTIGEIAAITMGQSPPSSVVNDAGNGLPFIQGNAEFGARYPKPRQFAADCPKVVDGGDILLSVRAPVGEVNVAPERLCIGRGLAGLRPTDGDHDFLFYAVGGLTPLFARLSQGSTFDAINGKDLRSIPLLVPPRDEQRRIAEVLRSVDEAIAAADATNKQAQIALDTARANLLTPSVDTTALGDVCNVIGGYAFKSTSFVESGVKVLRISNITESGVDFSGRAVCVAEQDVHGLDRFRLRPLDTVVALSGATTGKMCVFEVGEPVYVNQRVAFIRVKEGLADQGYINHVLSMLSASIRQSAYGGAQPNIRVRTHKRDSQRRRDVIHVSPVRRHGAWRISSGFPMSNGRGSNLSCRRIRAGCRG